MLIGYHKYQNDYIQEIEVINKIKNEYDIINNDTMTYWTNKYRIISIYNKLEN